MARPTLTLLKAESVHLILPALLCVYIFHHQDICNRIWQQQLQSYELNNKSTLQSVYFEM